MSNFYQIRKTYPGLSPDFQVGDILQKVKHLGTVTIYKKILIDSMAFIWNEHVENNPEFFKEIPFENVTVVIKE